MNNSNLHDALKGISVVEIGDQLGDYAALLLAGLGANVVKVEPTQGAASRRIGPFVSDTPSPEDSVFFWRYNLDKKSIALDLDNPAAREPLGRILHKADVLLLAGTFEAVEPQIAQYRELAGDNSGLIVCTITPFGLDGPYRDLHATDLTQMALGGVMAVCGYDPAPDRTYDTPPIAPAMWHSLHIAGEYAAISILAALNFRDLSGEGQFIDVSVHEAINTCTEGAMPMYIYNGQPLYRQTARHAMPVPTQQRLVASADGVYMLSVVAPFPREELALIKLLDQVGIDHVLAGPEYDDLKKEDPIAALDYRNYLVEQVVGELSAQELFERAQSLGLAWSPLRRPEESLEDPHFAARGTFAEIPHPELGRSIRYPATVAVDGHRPHMQYFQRAPKLGEHTHSVLQWAGFDDGEIASFRQQQLI